MSVYRKATSENHNSDESANRLMYDLELLNIYALRVPCSIVRFSRLRMSIRMVLRAPFELIALVHFASKDVESWMHALKADLLWMVKCDQDAASSSLEWCRFIRVDPKRARNLVRKASTSDCARSLTLAERDKAISALLTSYTCFCGSLFRSLAALDGHPGTFHGVLNPVQ